MRARHAGILLLAALVAACACSRGPDGTAAAPAKIADGEVRVHVRSVGYDPGAGAHYVLLVDGSGSRELPVMIGESEARAIALAVNGITPDRPLTQNLLTSIIEKTGNQVDRVAIVSMHHDTYYARIFMDHGRYSIDSRPSDAIALAINCRAPIYVAADLFKQGAGLPIAGGGPRFATAMGMTVEELTPALAQYFRVPAGQGAVVSNVDGAALKAGIRRGDVVMKIAGNPIAGPRDFTKYLKAIKAGVPFQLTLTRDGMPHIVTLSR